MSRTARPYAYTVSHRLRHPFRLAAVIGCVMLSACSVSQLPLNTSTSHYDGPPVLPSASPDLERPLGIEPDEWDAITQAMASHLLSVSQGGAFEFSSSEAAISGLVRVDKNRLTKGEHTCRGFDMTLQRVIGIERWLGTGCQHQSGSWTFSDLHPFSQDG